MKLLLLKASVLVINSEAAGKLSASDQNTVSSHTIIHTFRKNSLFLSGYFGRTGSVGRKNSVSE